MKTTSILIVAVISTVVTAIMLPSLFAGAQDTSSVISISIRRVNSWPADDLAALQNDTVKIYPSLEPALLEADKKYEAFTTWCESQKYNCFDNSYVKVLDWAYTTILTAPEAQSMLTGLGFKELEVPDKSPGLYHGIHIQHDGKFYAVSIGNVQKE